MGALFSAFEWAGSGFFDMQEAQYPRRQRLLAHSNLPRPPESFSAVGRYDILEELQKQGEFDINYIGSNELADICFRKVSPGTNRATETLHDKYFESILDAKFSSLFIHWNPRAVKEINSMIERFYTIADGYEDTTTLILSSERTPRSLRSAAMIRGEPIDDKVTRTLIKAQMCSFDVNLNSARDDYPLFVFSVSDLSIRS